MIFSCSEIVSFVSHLTTLEPGDVIATGTAAGVGSASKTHLQADDIVEATIAGIGTPRNPVGLRQDDLGARARRRHRSEARASGKAT